MHSFCACRDRFTRGTFFMLAIVAIAAPVQSEPQYTIEARVYCIKPDPSSGSIISATNVKADTLEVLGQPNSFYIAGNGELDISGVELYLKNGDVAWRAPRPNTSRDESGNNLSEEPDSDRVITIARPSLIALAGEEGKIDIVRPVQSFARRDDGTFELQTHGNAGLTFVCKITAARDAGRVMLDWKFTNKQVTGRKEIPGVSLPIGEPIVATETVQQKANVKLGDWSGIFQGMPDGNVTVNLIRVSKSRGGSK